jgi:uncharacterized protein (TIGR03435 family)
MTSLTNHLYQSTAFAAAAIVALATQQPAEKPLSFEVASIKASTFAPRGSARNGGAGGGAPAARTGGPGLRFLPGRVASGPMGVTAWRMILDAYRLTPYQLTGGPAWLESDRFDVEARAESANEDQLRQMLRTLLAERFQLAVHRESKETPVYVLIVAKSGSKLHEWKPGDPLPDFGAGGYANNFRDTGNIQRLIDTLSVTAARPVQDQTGLKGNYLFYAGWDEDGDLISAMPEQMGLKLEPQKAPLDVFTIDRIEKPSANQP